MLWQFSLLMCHTRFNVGDCSHDSIPVKLAKKTAVHLEHKPCTLSLFVLL